MGQFIKPENDALIEWATHLLNCPAKFRPEVARYDPWTIFQAVNTEMLVTVVALFQAECDCCESKVVVTAWKGLNPKLEKDETIVDISVSMIIEAEDIDLERVKLPNFQTSGLITGISTVEEAMERLGFDKGPGSG